MVGGATDAAQCNAVLNSIDWYIMAPSGEQRSIPCTTPYAYTQQPHTRSLMTCLGQLGRDLMVRSIV